MEFQLADLLESVAEAVPEREAIVSGDTRRSYAELDRRATRLAHALLRAGIAPGDHLGVYLYNGAEFLETMLAAFKIRAVPINVNYRYVEEELVQLFDNADLVGIVHQREFGPRLAAVAPRLPLLMRLVAVEDGSGSACPAPGARGVSREVASAAAERRHAARSRSGGCAPWQASAMPRAGCLAGGSVSTAPRSTSSPARPGTAPSASSGSSAFARATTWPRRCPG